MAEQPNPKPKGEIDEDRMTETPHCLQLFAHICRGLSPTAHVLLLENSEKTEVVQGSGDTWAYFPNRNRRRKELRLRPEVRVVLALNEEEARDEPDIFLSHTAHHLGHILCYLKNGR